MFIYKYFAGTRSIITNIINLTPQRQCLHHTDIYIYSTTVSLDQTITFIEGIHLQKLINNNLTPVMSTPSFPYPLLWQKYSVIEYIYLNDVGKWKNRS